MNYYFMPRVPGLTGAVTLANFPNVDGYVPWPPTMVAHVTWTDGKVWQVRQLCDIAPGHAVTFTETMLPDDCPADASPYFFMYPKALPRTLDELIVERFMATSPGWRGNIQLIGPTVSTSYQGEYTWNMVPIHTGTLLSFATFVQLGGNVTTQFILPNLRRDPRTEECRLRFASARTRKVLKEAVVYRNKCSVVPLAGMEVEEGEMVVAVSPDLTGIPLYLTHTLDFSQMSFEHTHPPSELLVFGDRAESQRHMKTWWLTEVMR